jgi:hypothetical protein
MRKFESNSEPWAHTTPIGNLTDHHRWRNLQNARSRFDGREMALAK